MAKDDNRRNQEDDGRANNAKDRPRDEEGKFIPVEEAEGGNSGNKNKKNNDENKGNSGGRNQSQDRPRDEDGKFISEEEADKKGNKK